jgi:hypothetical protein
VRLVASVKTKKNDDWFNSSYPLMDEKRKQCYKEKKAQKLLQRSRRAI